MKTRLISFFVIAAFLCGGALARADYATDIATVGEAQTQALEQAMQMLAQAKKPEIRDALNKAMEDMKHAQLMLAGREEFTGKTQRCHHHRGGRVSGASQNNLA